MEDDNYPQAGDVLPSMCLPHQRLLMRISAGRGGFHGGLVPCYSFSGLR